MKKRIKFAAFAGVIICIVLTVVLSACPVSEVEPFPATTPTATVTTMPRVTSKTAVFTLTSNHPVNSIWRAYESETSVEPLRDVDVSHLALRNTLTLTYRHNVLPAGTYWVAVTERGTDASQRLALTVVD